MRTQKIWNLMYVAGNPKMFTKVIANASNPLKRSEAVEAAEQISKNGWRVWVEHVETKERIYESAIEIQYRQTEALGGELVQ